MNNLKFLAGFSSLYLCQNVTTLPDGQFRAEQFAVLEFIDDDEPIEWIGTGVFPADSKLWDAPPIMEMIIDDV